MLLASPFYTKWQLVLSLRILAVLPGTMPPETLPSIETMIEFCERYPTIWKTLWDYRDVVTRMKVLQCEGAMLSEMALMLCSYNGLFQKCYGQ